MRLVVLPLAAVLTLLLLAPDHAGAKLRSPHLESSCPAGFTYGEVLNGPWRVEGCAKGDDPRGSELKRTVFTGTVEVNGMLIEGSKDLIAYSSSDVANASRVSLTSGQFTTYGIKRGSGSTIVIDQASRPAKRDEIYRGKIDLTLETNKKVKDGTAFTLDIPTSSSAKINGMRLREAITGATLKRGGAEQTLSPDDLRPRQRANSAATVQTSDGTIEFRGKLSFASSVSALLRDWTSPSKFKLVDGEGLQTDNVKFELDAVVIPGIGGFNDFSITYNAARDEWIGSVDLDLGEDFVEIHFQVNVDGTTGAILRIEADVTGLRIPIGNTGATLREISGFFQPNPLVFGGGVGATYGPKLGSYYLVEISGTLSIQLEPNFRLETGGSARLLATSPTSQLARGSSELIFDSRGLLAVSADANVSVDIGGGIGAEANARGSGAFSTKNSRFNIEASVSGELFLGFLGDFTVARIDAVISSEGWGTCAQLVEFIKGGIGQHWGDGIKVFTGCDLSEYQVPISTSAAVAGQRSFVVGPDVDRINIEVTADGPEPKVALIAPGGTPVASSAVLGRRKVGNNASVIAMPGQSQQIFAVNKPKSGLWKVAWPDASANVTGVRIARSKAPIDADVTVTDTGTPGQRRIRVAKLKNLAGGERAVIGVRTPAGIVPLGESGGKDLTANFADTVSGARQIVVIPLRDGIPNPTRMRTLGSFTSKLPDAASGIKTKRNGSKLKASATLKKGKLKPSAWVYILRSSGRPIAVRRGKPGKFVTFSIPAGSKKLTIAARPMIGGRVLKVTQRTKSIR